MSDVTYFKSRNSTVAMYCSDLCVVLCLLQPWRDVFAAETKAALLHVPDEVLSANRELYQLFL